MKKSSLLFILLSLFGLSAISQSCLPEGITFINQEQIDNFQVNYPNCTEIEGNVLIQGDDISNLNGLENVSIIMGNLALEANNALTTLTGLESLTTIGGGLRIVINDGLTSLTGLENLTSIGEMLWIAGNYDMTTLAGLENLSTIGGGLGINGTVLISLSGLESLISIENSLTIQANFSLTNCEAQGICDYLVSANPTINIENNASGCNSQEELEEACLSGTSMPNLETEFSIYPIPANNNIFIESKNGLRINEVIIYNQLGQMVLHINEIREEIDISTLEQGIYMMVLTSNKMRITQKIIIEKQLE